MAKVFLRVYNREIESMIDGGQLDEAVAHCQYILKTFPMYIETYRLLGKAYLEARRYTDAADIFQRALMAVPDDFVSHVGMSIIHDDAGKLDDAIWHMERAFEVQPSNSAIQGELRRLYGRRDGVEPAKIRLSRDALSNMYFQGELFNQAIAEIRSVLAEDPNRPDLQVMLARAYYRSGQKVEAAEMAAALLKKYPYCMDALRVLVDVLPGTSRAENTQAYRQRLRLLDPYSSFAIDSVFTSDQVVDSAVNMERLEYKSGPMPVSSQPDWASSLGVKLNDEQKADTPPDWMQAAEDGEQTSAFAPEPSGSESAPAAKVAADSVPDWMRSAGWQESTGEPQAGSGNSEEALPDEPIVKADIPDWLKSMAPAQAPEEAKAEPEEPAGDLPIGGDGIPDWLKPKAPAGTAGQPPTASQPPAGIEPVPDWLKSTSPAGAAADAQVNSQPPAAPQPTSQDDLPDWLKSMNPAGSAEASHVETQPSVESQPQPAEQQSAAPQLTGEDDFPDWLKSMAPAESAEAIHVESRPPVESESQPAEMPPDSEEAIPDWLKSIAPAGIDVNVHIEPQQPAELEPQVSGEEAVPEWLKATSPAGEAVENNHVESQQPAESQPIEPQPAGGDDVLDWLKTLGPLEPAVEAHVEPEQPVLSQSPASEATVPDWLKAMVPAESVRSSDGVPESAALQGSPLKAEPEQTPAGTPSASAQAFPDWSMDMGARASAAQTAAALVANAVKQPGTGTSLKAEPEQIPAGKPLEPAQAFPDWPMDLGARASAAQTAASLAASAAKQPVTSPQPANKPLASPETTDEAKPSAKSASYMPGTQGDAFQPTGEVTRLNIEDDALAWLESLAAKQGAKPEELLTTPNERSGEMPDWLRQSGEKPVVAPVPPEQEPAPSTPGLSQQGSIPVAPGTPAQEPVRHPSHTLPLEPLSRFTEPSASQPSSKEEVLPVQAEGPLPSQPSAEPATQLPAQQFGEADDTMAWLEQLSGNQGTNAEEAGSSAVGSLETTPDWFQKSSDNQPATPVQEEAVPAVPEMPAEDITITSWLSKLDVEEAVGKKSPEALSEVPPAAPAEELPDWLKDIEKPTAPLEAPKADNDLPEWLRHPTPPSEPEPIIPTPTLEPASDLDMPAWMDENIPVAGEAAPTMPEEWVPAETKAAAGPVTTAAPTPVAAPIPPAVPTTPVMPPVVTPSTPVTVPTSAVIPPQVAEPSPTAASIIPIETPPAVEPTPVAAPAPTAESTPVVASALPIEPPLAAEPVPIPVQTPVKRPTLKQTGMLSHVPLQDKDAELLSSAQTVLDQNSLEEAMKRYAKLIKKGRLLDEIIHDLREAIYRYPVDVIIWQTLGDAYMRANRLQDALDAYTKAEELLR
ncbi:MAG: tetratricopeptide repeat protein [Anaerolineales bacterium]